MFLSPTQSEKKKTTTKQLIFYTRTERISDDAFTATQVKVQVQQRARKE